MPSLYRYVAVHGVKDVEAWARRHGVEPQTIPCPRCKEPRRTTIPIAKGKTRGLQCPPCECGEPFQPYTYLMGPT